MLVKTMVTTLSLCCSMALAMSVSAEMLFTTQEDFTGWGGTDFIAAPQATQDLDGSLTNGEGNPTDAGGTGTGGSLGVSSSTTFGYLFSQDQQGNADFIAALGDGGQIAVDHVNPTGGTYFQLGLVLNYNGHFDQYFGDTVDNGDGTSTTIIDFEFVPGDVATYLQLGVIFNSDATNSPFTVDNIRIVPEPASVALCAAGGLILLARRRKA